MTTIHFWSPKGGVGTTVATVMAARVQREAYPSRKILLVDRSAGQDMHKVLGMTRPPEDELVDVADNIQLVLVPPDSESNAHLIALLEPDAGVDLVFVDRGTIPPNDGMHSVLVMDNSYLCLSRVAEHNTVLDRAVVVIHPQRAIQFDDIQSMFTVRGAMVEVPWSDSIARTIDAGLLMMGRETRNMRSLAAMVPAQPTRTR